MKVSVCVLARNEERSVRSLMSQLSEQTLVTRNSYDVDINLVANACSDATVHVARSAASQINWPPTTRVVLHDLAEGGKSRSWNKAVHTLLDLTSDYLVFVDADVELTSKHVIEDLVLRLDVDPNLQVCSGYPIKDIEKKAHRTAGEALSLVISKRTRHVGVINGSLYVARTSCLTNIWLPDSTPGEDGFLNAMVCTNGFSSPEQPNLVAQSETPTHYFKATSPREFIAHEKRMIVGTAINRWIFEYLWSLELAEPAGPLIDWMNCNDPNWVQKIIHNNVEGKLWVVPSALLFARFAKRVGETAATRLAKLPVALVATLATVPPALAANAALKRQGAAETW